MNHPSLKKKMILINPWLLSNGNLKKIKIILLIETLTFSSTMMASSGNNKFNDILEKQDFFFRKVCRNMKVYVQFVPLLKKRK